MLQFRLLNCWTEDADVMRSKPTIRLTKSCSSSVAWWNKALSGQCSFVDMDCDVAAAFDHVSLHVITDAMEAMRVPPVVVAAWIRE